LKLTLAQWLVLDASDRLICESNDAVSQIQVARRLEMNKTTVCQVMQTLERRGLVDQAPQFRGTAYRIYLTEAGKSAARQGRDWVESKS
jgi:DNA-binding MarR family transcriptional regulator